MPELSTDGLKFIQQFEGFSAVPYQDAAGLWTIGYGHLIQMGENLTYVSVEEANVLLRKDVQTAVRAVKRYIHIPLGQGQFDALVSFTFNSGSGALQRSTLRQKVNREEHEAAAVEFLRWVWAGGRKLPGLVRRRQAESDLYSSYTV